jgi:hypothetical protein
MPQEEKEIDLKLLLNGFVKWNAVIIVRSLRLLGAMS